MIVTRETLSKTLYTCLNVAGQKQAHALHEYNSIVSRYEFSDTGKAEIKKGVFKEANADVPGLKEKGLAALAEAIQNIKEREPGEAGAEKVARLKAIEDRFSYYMDKTVEVIGRNATEYDEESIERLTAEIEVFRDFLSYQSADLLHDNAYVMRKISKTERQRIAAERIKQELNSFIDRFTE